MTKTKLADEIVTLTEASSLTGYSKTYVYKMIDAGHVQNCTPGKFRLGALIQGVIAFTKAKTKVAPKSPNQERIIAAKAKQMEMQNQITAKDLCRTADMLALTDEVVGGMAASLHSLHVTVTRDPVLREKIRIAVADICKRTCEKLDKRSAQLLGNAPLEEEGNDPEEEHGQS